MTLLSVADRLATRGRGSDVAIARHLAARARAARRSACVAGQPATASRPRRRAGARRGLEPGPEIGRVLAELEEASFAGEIASAEEAIEWARELLAGQPARER